MSHDHLAGSDEVSEDVYKTTESLKENTQVNLGQLMHAAYIFVMGDPFHGQLTAVATRYPLTSIS